MQEILIFGHKNPDTDTICTTLAKAYLEQKKQNNVKPVRLRNLNKETKYVLNYLNIDPMEKIQSVENDQKVMLVDHNEFGQSADNIENAKILSVTDHHRIANFQTKEPLEYAAKPYGCTSSIVYEQFKENGIEIPKDIAILMASAIISDTLLLKSPTTTNKDKQYLKELGEIAGIDINEYGLEMLKAGTNLDDYSEKELLDMDQKVSEKNNVKYAIAQVNTVDINKILEREDELRKEIEKEIKEKDLSCFIFVITDILNSDSLVLVLGKRPDLISKTYELKDDKALLKGVVSRKKQILPLVESNI